MYNNFTTSISHNALELVAEVAEDLAVVLRNTCCCLWYSSAVKNFCSSAWNSRTTSPCKCTWYWSRWFAFTFHNHLPVCNYIFLKSWKHCRLLYFNEVISALPFLNVQSSPEMRYKKGRDTCGMKVPTLYMDFYNGKFQKADQSDYKKFIECVKLRKRQFCWPNVYLRYQQHISAGYIWKVSNKLHINDIRLYLVTILCSEFNILQYITITKAIFCLSQPK